jgi:hypothetical protein
MTVLTCASVNRRTFLASAGAAGVVATAGCTADGEGTASSETNSEVTDRTTSATSAPDADPSKPPFRVGDDGFERLADGEYGPLQVQGVNIGMAKPGRFPGEAAITRREYDRWLAAIGEMANVVRTYTIHPPAFYSALAAYNESASTPLLLLQGTWVPTRDLLDSGDATGVSSSVDDELRRAVDAVHGATTLPERPGHASGTYDADVSDHTLGFLFGIEWPPEVVAATNDAGGDGEYAGTYLRTRDGTPFERWLTERLDRLVAHETTTYGTQRPVSFVNWVTTDPLDHPYEPFVDEDRVSVDPDAVRATSAFDPGVLATYHVYPYYPDALNENPAYVDYVDHRGEPNNFAGYLDDLVSHTVHPVLVGEFGVPSSRGIAHRNVHGRDQGRHTEREQGEIVAAMFEDVDRAGTAGGVAFSWQDEWFKRTWNLDARSVPGRRPYWSNVETPEQRFGLLAFDPVDAVSLSGSEDDWTDARTVRPTDATAAPAERTLAGLDVTHDLEGLCLRVQFESLPTDWTGTNAFLGVGLTGRRNPLPFDVDASVRADFLVHLAGPTNSRLLVDARYDAFAREFGEEAGLPLDQYRDGTAGFVPVREPVNRGYTVPATGERVPFDAVETGELRYGNGDPDAGDYDSLTDVHVDTEAATVELRLPWVLLNVADPSSKRRIATDWTVGLEAVESDGVTVSAGTFGPSPDREADASAAGSLAHAIPGERDGRVDGVSYEWESWTRPTYEERLKESYDVLRRERPL